MLNIVIKGKFQDESQLIQDKKLPEKAVQFKEGDTIHSAFLLGFVLGLPVMLLMIILSVIRCSGIDKRLEIVLGIIPFFIWYIIAQFLQVEWIVCTMVLNWMMTFMSIGDFANVFNAIRQVPRNGRVFNYDMHSYWIE